METAQKNDSFQYHYSANQQNEIKQIRQKYLPQEDSKIDQLRKLDQSATRPGRIASIFAGIAGALLLGVGMCCTMLWAETLFIPGIVIGVAGLAVLALTYPLYSLITKRQRRKLAPEILRLSQELLE